MMVVMMMMIMIKKRNTKKEKKIAGLAEPLGKSRGEMYYTPRTADNDCLCPILLTH
jgi:hypothetical protein